MSQRMSALAPWARVAFGVDGAGARARVVRAVRRRGRISWAPVPAAGLTACLQKEPQAAWACRLPPGPGITAWLQTPLQDRRKAARVMPSVLDMRLPFPLEECLYACTAPEPASSANLPLSGEGTAALAVAVRKNDLTRHLDALQEQGIDPHVLDHEALALWTGIPPGDAGTIRIILWPSDAGFTLVFGMGAHYWSALQVAAAPDAILQQIRLMRHTLADGQFKQAPVQWCFPEVVDRTHKEHLLAAEPGSVLTLPDGEHYLARSLAERALRPGALRFNLRRQAFAHTGASRQRERQRAQQAFVLLGCSIVLAVMNGVSMYTRARTLQAMDQQVQALADRVAGYPVQASGRDALLIAEREQAAREAALQPLEFAAQLPGVSGRLAATVAAAGGSLHMLRLDTQSARLVGTMPAADALSPLVDLLVEAGFSVAPPELDVGEDRVRFQLDASREQEEQP